MILNCRIIYSKTIIFLNKFNLFLCMVFDQKEFDDFIALNGVYGFFEEPITLSSGRLSYFYANFRNIVEDVCLTGELADFIIDFLESKGLGVDTFYGVPDGATKIGLITQFKYAQRAGVKKGSHVLAMGRKTPKDHGAAKDKFFVGMPKGRVVVIEDVTTTGGSLIKALKSLRESGVNVVAVVSLTNRMERRDDGLSVAEAVRSEGFDFYSLSSSLDVLPVVAEKESIDADILRKVEVYFDKYGVDKLRFGGCNSADELMDKVDEKQSPCIIGLDPQLDMIPSFIKNRCLEEFGNTRKAAAEAFIEFCKGIVDATYDLAPAYKPNMCFFEKYGAEGVRAFEEVATYVKSKGCVVIEDAKRNEIGHSAKAYADGHLGEVDMLDGTKAKSIDADFLVVNPYLGSDGLNPFIEVCGEHGKGIFVMAKTSNPSSGEFQDKTVLINSDERDRFEDVGMNVGEDVQLYNLVALRVNDYAQKYKGKRGYSCVGAVVGATYPEQARQLRRIMPSSYFLVPGYGAQGGSAEGLTNCFNSDGYGAVVNSSRGIIFAYKKGGDEVDYALCARKAFIEMNEDIKGALLNAGKFPAGWESL